MPRASVTRFSAILGHARAGEFLRTAVANDRLAHALVFAGPDGVGKRSVALALAAWQQCAAPSPSDACGDCAPCRQIAAGSHPDVQLVAVATGKKEIGVDRMRDLKRFMQLQPLCGKAKVAIIDNAHMLTVAAQNALLKTLEEPPSRSLLILVANNPDALLPTVRSRCQRLHFFALDTDSVVGILVAHGIDAAAAREVAALAEGSPGRALALSTTLTGAGREHLRQQLATLGRARYVDVMQLAGEMGQPEAEVGVKLEMLLSLYRDDAMRALAASRAVAEDSLGAILRRADAVSDSWNAVRQGNPNRQLLLEALLLRLASIV